MIISMLPASATGFDVTRTAYQVSPIFGIRRSALS